MKHRTLLSAALAFLFVLLALPGMAQLQTGLTVSGSSNANNVFGGVMTVYNVTTPSCQPKFAVVPTSTAWGSTNYGTTSNLFSLNGGNGNRTINLGLFWYNYTGANVQPTFQVFVDGQPCSTCTATVTGHSQGGPFVDPAECTTTVTITHQAGYAFDKADGAHEFGLRMSLNGTPRCDFRFKGIMLGNTFTDVLGYYNSPGLPLYILRDPPGDMSYSRMATATNSCVGHSQKVSMSQEANTWFKAKLGIAGETGFIVSLDFEFYVELGGSITATRSETSAYEYRTCFDYNQEFQTPATGSADDQFVIQSSRYAYGMATVIARPSCGTVTKRAEFVSALVSTLETELLSDSYIRYTRIPETEQELALLVQGTPVHDALTEQLSVYRQTLAMNDSIKAHATQVNIWPFAGGGGTQLYTQSTTTSEHYAIDYTVALEGEFTTEFKVEIGGSGVSGGTKLKMRNEWGNGETNTNTTTNTMGFLLGDSSGDPDAAGPKVPDYYRVIIGQDKVFGTYTFKLDSATSRTSCPYEGGYQLDQPQLHVGSMGNSQMTIDNASPGTILTYPLYICNNSNFVRDYFVRVEDGTNTEGGVVVLTGENISSDVTGRTCASVPANGCYAVANLFLSDYNPLDTANNFDIDLHLYAACEPDIHSEVNIKARYGAGPAPAVQVAARAFLEGPFNGTTMNDGLRSAGTVPLTEPYTALGYTYQGTGATTTTSGVLAVTGNNAVVDWVIVELRNSAGAIQASRCGLLQRDGDIVAPDGTSPLSFVLPSASYRVAVRHRNHLGAMTSALIPLSGTPTTVDLTSAATATFGTDARKTSGSYRLLWAGDVSFDGTLRYTGSNNDRDPILQRIGGTVPTNTSTGYHGSDVNMDGTTRYTGTGNDRDPILQNVGGVVPTSTRTVQLP